MTLKTLMTEIEKMNKTLEMVNDPHRYTIANTDDEVDNLFFAHNKKELASGLNKASENAFELMNGEVTIFPLYKYEEITASVTVSVYWHDGEEEHCMRKVLYLAKL